MKASKFIILLISIVVLVVINLLLGTVRIPVGEVCSILMGAGSDSEIWTNIVISSRLPQVLTAIVAGAGLAVSGLQMQTVFRNPLAGPSVLGISNGSALGVAFVVLLSGKIGGVALSRLGYLGDAAMSVAAIVGALAVMLLIVWISQKVKGNVTLLIIGVMIGYLANAIIGVLKFLSPEEDVKSFVVWGLGSFSRVSGDEMVLFVVLMCILLPISFLLDQLDHEADLSERYADRHRDALIDCIKRKVEDCNDSTNRNHQAAEIVTRCDVIREYRFEHSLDSIDLSSDFLKVRLACRHHRRRQCDLDRSDDVLEFLSGFRVGFNVRGSCLIPSVFTR